MALTDSEFQLRLLQRADQTHIFLEEQLSDVRRGGEVSRPGVLMQAIRHGALNGGKRIRPFLILEVAALFGASDDMAMHAAAGLECLHCYSLVHDDLPAMDDDDVRRGQPTVHKAFDEAAAILAGDALLTFAFELTASSASGLSAEQRVQLVSQLALASGVGGMVGGQQLDLEHEVKMADEAMITRIHAMKTGALLRYACEAGAIVGGAEPEQRSKIRRFGEVIGLAFQLADDVLDVTADATQMGKATAKDAAAGKSTLVGIYGIDWARDRLDSLVREAEDTLSSFGQTADILRSTARFIAHRSS